MHDKGKKRKVVARGSGSQPRDPEHNAELFKSWRCEKFYNSIGANAKFVRERSIILDEGEFNDIRENIHNRGWDKYVAYPKVASKSLVFEFFSNALPKTVDGQVVFPGIASYVRGRKVPFDAATINSLFELAPVPSSNFLYKTKVSRRRVQESTEKADEIRNALCKPGCDWVRNASGEPQNILNSSLTPVARAWAAFISATIYPSSNHTELSLERAILASCIIRGEPVNLGWVLEKELREFANFKNDAVRSYWRFASLIALLCEKAGVVASPEEEVIEPGIAITGNWIRTRLGLEFSDPRAEPSQPPVQEDDPHQGQPDEREPTFEFRDFDPQPTLEDFQHLQMRIDGIEFEQRRMAEMQERMFQEQLAQRRGIQAVYNAVSASHRGIAVDPDVDIFQQPPQ